MGCFGLRRHKPLKRRSSLRSWSGRVSGPDQLTRAVVLDRDGGVCVVCGRGGVLLDPHHRRPVGRGGSRDAQVHSPSNLICLCRRCHDWIHEHPRLAREAGFLVSRGVDPLLVPVRIAVRGLVFLTADGGLVDVADVVDPGDVTGVA